MNDDAPAGLGSLLRSSTRDECDSIQERMKSIIGSTGCSFWKENERPFGGRQDLHCGLDRLLVDSFAIDAETSHHPDGPSGEAILIKKVPTGHREHVCSNSASQPAHHERIGGAAMVRRQQDPVPGSQRCFELFSVTDFVPFNSFPFPKM